MKKKGKVQIILVAFLMLVLLGGAATVVILGQVNNDEPQVVEANDMVSFAKWFDIECCKQVPAMVVDDTKIGQAVDYGYHNYLIAINGTTKGDYQAYLTLLEKNDFRKYVDNGEGLDDGNVLSATYTKDDLVVTVTQIERMEKTYVSINEETPLSEHLYYDNSYIADNKEGAKTTLSMLQQYDVGNSFVLQLKNGHFIISDGGKEPMLPYLLDYLDSLTPKGEKPVVEAWFITHPHGDHSGIMKTFIGKQELTERLYVNGIYFNMPGDNANAKDSTAARNSSYISFAAAALQTETGETPEIYRPQTGQRYYFNDITIDIAFTQEQISPDAYLADINEASTWCMLTVDGQKVLMTGDADRGAMKHVLWTYSPEYLTVDVITSFHHSVNTWDVYTDYAKVGTYLVTEQSLQMKYAGNDYLLTRMDEMVDEIIDYGSGTVVLTFPYVKGTVKTLAPEVWRYNESN